MVEGELHRNNPIRAGMLADVEPVEADGIPSIAVGSKMVHPGGVAVVELAALVDKNAGVFAGVEGALIGAVVPARSRLEHQGGGTVLVVGDRSCQRRLPCGRHRLFRGRRCDGNVTAGPRDEGEAEGE